MAAVVLTIVRWYLLVRALQIPFRVRDALRLGFLGYLFNFVSLGSVGGDLFKAVFMAREQPGRRAEAVATVFIDRVIGLYGLFLLATAAILATGQLSSSVPEILFIARATIVCTVLGTLGIVMLLVPGFTTGALSEMLSNLPRTGHIFRKLITAVRMYRQRIGIIIAATVMSVGVHTLSTLSFCLVAWGLPGATPPTADNFVAVPLALVAGAAPLPFSGLGALEGALSFLYAHIPENAALYAGRGLLVALGYRAITVLIAIVGALFCFGSPREVADLLHEAGEAEAASDEDARSGVTMAAMVPAAECHVAPDSAS